MNVGKRFGNIYGNLVKQNDWPRKSSWWFQPLWKILYSQNGKLPQIGAQIKNIWNHHLEIIAATPQTGTWAFSILAVHVVAGSGCPWNPGWSKRGKKWPGVIPIGGLPLITWNNPPKNRRNPTSPRDKRYVSIFRGPIFPCNSRFLWWTPKKVAPKNPANRTLAWHLFHGAAPNGGSHWGDVFLVASNWWMISTMASQKTHL